MKTLLKTFTCRFTSESFDNCLAQWFCWLSTLAVMIVSLRKLAAMELTEAQLILAVLLSVATALLFTTVGLLFWMVNTLRKPVCQSGKP